MTIGTATEPAHSSKIVLGRKAVVLVLPEAFAKVIDRIVFLIQQLPHLLEL